MTTPNSSSNDSIWSSASDLEVLYSGIGIYNDRGVLALSREKHQFPDVCLKTGAPTTHRYTLNRRMLERAAPVGTPGGEVSAEFVILEQLAGDQLNLKIPLSLAWLEANGRYGARRNKGWRITGTGLVLLFLGILLMLFSPFFGAIMVVGLVLSFYGLFAGGVSLSDPPFRIIQLNPNFIWLEEANEDVARRFEPMPSNYVKN